MSYKRKLSISLLILIMLFVTMALGQTAFAQTLDSDKFAQTLYDLGLYKGISETTFVPDLDSTLDRQTGVIVLLRLFGQEENALDMDTYEVNEALKNFSDKDVIAYWAKKQVAYAVKNGYMAGFPDNTIRPFRTLTGKEYCALVLKRLNVPFEFHEAAKTFTTAAEVNEDLADRFGVNTPILKKELVNISYISLNAKKFRRKTSFAIII